MTDLSIKRHALGLPQGSIRVTHVLGIVGLMCALIVNPTEKVIPIPPYLIYLLFLMLGHFFGSSSVSVQRPGESPPLYLPAWLVRLFVVLAICASVGWKMYQNPDGLEAQLELSMRILRQQPYLPLIILGGFFLGVLLRLVVGRENPPSWLQDFEAWVSLIGLIGLVVAVIIHLVIEPSLEEGSIQLPQWEGILGGIVAFYFGERS